MTTAVSSANCRPTMVGPRPVDQWGQLWSQLYADPPPPFVDQILNGPTMDPALWTLADALSSIFLTINGPVGSAWIPFYGIIIKGKGKAPHPCIFVSTILPLICTTTPKYGIEHSPQT